MVATEGGLVIPLDAVDFATTAEPQPLGGGQWALALPLPTRSPAYTLCYIFEDEDRGVHILDPGWDTEENEKLLEQALAVLGRSFRDVRTVIATHLHHDHLGLLSDLQRMGAQVVLSAPEHIAHELLVGDGWPILSQQSDANERRGVPVERRAEIEAAALQTAARARPLAVDRLVEHGEVIRLGHRELRVHITPGHTTGHMCLVDDATGRIFTGDHVLPTIHPGFGLGGPSSTNPLEDYLASLAEVGALGDLEVCAGHEFRFRGLADRAEAIARHHDRRGLQIRAARDELGGGTVWEVASRVTWSSGFERLGNNSLRIALNQVSIHLDRIDAQDARGVGY